MRARRGLRQLCVWALGLAIIGSGLAYAAEAPPSGAEEARPPVPQADTGQGTQQGMCGMCCMMGKGGQKGMGGCGGMCGMNMSGMNISGMGMNHGAAATPSLTDLAQNVSLRDITRMVQDVITIQERLLAAVPQDRAAEIKPDLDRVKDRTRELLTEIRGMISAGVKGE